MEEAGVPVTEDMVCQGNLRQDSGFLLAQRCLEGETGKAAICCNNFLMCLGAMSYAQQRGKVMWKDYGMAICEQPPVFYQDSEFIYAGPKLQEIGKAAAQLLLERINQPDKERTSIRFSPLDVYLP